MARRLDKREATRAWKILQGLIIMSKQKTSTSKIAVSEVLAQAEELGKTS